MCFSLLKSMIHFECNELFTRAKHTEPTENVKMHIWVVIELVLFGKTNETDQFRAGFVGFSRFSECFVKANASLTIIITCRNRRIKPLLF